MEDIIDIIVTETTNLITITSSGSDEVIDVNIIDNREDITLNVTPSVVEININSLTGNFGVNWGDIEGTLSNQTDLNTALGLKADLVDGKVPSSQLPSYVDDVVEVANYASLPVTGEVGKIYITLDTNYIYRWSGSTYIEIKDSSAVWGAITGTLSSQTDLQTALDAKQDDLNGTGFVKASGTTITYDNSTYLTTSSAASTYVPYTGATGNVDLGTHKLTSYDLVVNHASGSGVAVSITKGGSGEALTVVKSSGSGNAASITGGTTLLSELNVTGAITGTTATFTNSGSGIGLGVTQSGGTGDGIKITHSAGRAFNILSSGSGFGIIINNETASTSAPFTIQKQGASVITLTDAGAGSFASSLTASSFIRSGGTSAQFLKADGSVDSSTYLPLTGGTLTGNLNGTSANFSSYLNAQTTDISNSTAANSLRITHTNGSYHAVSITATGGSALYATGSVSVIGTLLATGVISAQSGLANGVGQSFALPTTSGTLALTSQLSSYLPLSGGTLTGALSGTSATFSSTLTSDSLIISASDARIRNNDATGRLVLGNSTTSTFGIFYGASHATTPNTIALTANSITSLTIASTGAATFSSSIAATSASFSAGVSAVGQFLSSSTTIQGFYQSRTSDTASQGVFGGNSFTLRNGATSEDLNFDIFNRTTSVWTTPFVIKNTGAATFWSSVTAGGVIKTETYFNAGSGSAKLVGVGSAISGGFSSTDMVVYNTGGDLYLIGTGAAGMIVKGTSGNVGIGTTNPTVAAGMGLVINGGATSPRIALKNNASGDASTDGFQLVLTTENEAVLENRENASMRFLTNATEAMRITSGGLLVIGATSALINESSLGASSNGNTVTFKSTLDGGNPLLLWNTPTINNNGFIQFGTEGSFTVRGSIDYNRASGLVRYNVTSDYRLKTDLKKFNGSDILDKIKVYDYKLKESGARVYGVMAHELQEVISYAVGGVKDGEKMQSVDYSIIVPIMIQSIKELKLKIENLKNK